MAETAMKPSISLFTAIRIDMSKMDKLMTPEQIRAVMCGVGEVAVAAKVIALGSRTGT